MKSFQCVPLDDVKDHHIMIPNLDQTVTESDNSTKQSPVLFFNYKYGNTVDRFRVVTPYFNINKIQLNSLCTSSNRNKHFDISSNPDFIVISDFMKKINNLVEPIIKSLQIDEKGIIYEKDFSFLNFIKKSYNEYVNISENCAILSKTTKIFSQIIKYNNHKNKKPIEVWSNTTYIQLYNLMKSYHESLEYRFVIQPVVFYFDNSTSLEKDKNYKLRFQIYMIEIRSTDTQPKSIIDKYVFNNRSEQIDDLNNTVIEI